MTSGVTIETMASEGRGESANRGEGPPSRVIIEGVRPEIDDGRFPIKRTVGEEVVVTADIFAEGHDILAAVIQHRAAGRGRVGRGADDAAGQRPLDRPVHASTPWAGTNTRSQAWVDRFASWHRELTKKSEAGQDVASELLEGAELVREAAGARRGARRRLAPRPRRAARPRRTTRPPRIRAALDPELAAVDGALPRPPRAARPTTGPCGVMVERERARFGAWYEMFPRSCSPEPGPARDVQGRRGAAALRRRRWASTSSTCRRSTRSAGASARGRTTP